MFRFKGGSNALLIAIMLLATSLSPILFLSSGDGANKDNELPFLIKDRTGQLPPLMTRWGTFPIDHLYEEVPFFEVDLDSSIWIVQFNGPIEKGWKEDLEKEGFDVLEYLPEFSFTVRTEGKDPEDLLDLENVIAAGPFPSGMKMDPQTYIDLETGNSIQDSVGEEMLVVDTFPAQEDITLQLNEISPVVKKESPTRYLIGPSIESREELISIFGISHIEPYYSVELHNNVSKDIINVQEVWDDLGLDGTGQVVAISDTGLDTGVDDHQVNGDINLDFDNRATIVNWAGSAPDDEHSHGTHTTGSIAGDGTNSGGNIKGMAPNASIFFQAIMTDGKALSIPANTSLLFQQAYDNGSRIHTNSWGSDVSGLYTSRAQDVDWFLFNYPEMIILYSAGNNGYDWDPEDGRIDLDSIGSPGTAKNCITVGASENYRLTGGSITPWGNSGAWKYINGSWVVYSKYPKEPILSDLKSDNVDGMAAFSSVGPTDDGRIKPDVVAPGTNVLSCRSSITGAGTGWGVYNSDYIYMGGTSMSTPITAGAVVLMREFFNSTLGLSSPSGALLKASLINGAVDLTPGQYGPGNSTVQEIQGRPDMHQGWGRINISNSLQPDNGNMTFLDDKEGLWTGNDITSYFQVKDSENDLRITLAYADFPGALYSSKELVNDLDLILIAPNGTEYYGNDWSSPFNDTFDRTNPIEGITIQSPAVGTWKLLISAYNIPIGPQHFAVVVSGDISNLSSLVSLDKQFYSTKGDPISITVMDPNLVGNGTAMVTLNSTTDGTGITLILTEIGSSGLFKGKAWTRNNATGNSSSLQVMEDDIIIATYQDDDPADTFTSTAISKDPVEVFLKEKMDLHLTQGEYERVFIEGTISTGTEAWWVLESSGIGWRPFHDDGNSTYGDTTPDDGNITDVWIVPQNITGSFMLKTRVLDPFLGNRTYSHFPMYFNSSVPRYPKNVSVQVLPQGNSVKVSWENSNETDLSYNNIYINSSSISGGKQGEHPTATDGWSLIASTVSLIGEIDIGGLVDGLKYSFRVSVVDKNGNESSLSVLFNATPQDLIPPDAVMVTTPRTIVGIITFEFTGSTDLETVQMQFYNDINGNGLMDDGNWEVAGEGPYTGVIWDTRTSAGGPGDVDSLFLRYRGLDEALNIGDWSVNEDFHIDNTGPSSVSFLDPPSAVTNVVSHQVSGTSEMNGRVEVWKDHVFLEELMVNSIGGFEFVLNLTEGKNHVNLSAYDEFGAGPTNMSYNFTLDTKLPVARLDVEDQSNITRNIVPEGLELISTSFDNGDDPYFTYIENFTWRVTDPLGMVTIHYGNGTLPFELSMLGNFSIRLTVRDPAGNINFTLLGIEVIDTIAPTGEILGQFSVNEDETASFEINITDNDVRWFNREGAGVLWEVNGEDYNWTSTESTAHISLSEPGQYTLNLTVTDGGGNQLHITRTISVTDLTPPDGNIIGPTTVTLGIPATFKQNLTDNNRSFPSGAEFHWNLTYQEVVEPMSEFFDGKMFNFTFILAGSYLLTLIAKDRSGNEREVQMLLRAIGDLTPPSIKSITPEENESFQFSEELMITVSFDEPLDTSTITQSELVMTDDEGGHLNITINIKGPSEVQVIPQGLEYGRTYTLRVGTGISDLWDNQLISGMTVNYTIRTHFSLDYPDGVFPSNVDQNFSGNEDDIYNITLMFTNPVQVSSVVNALRVFSVRIEDTSGYPREVKEEISFFVVNPGPDDRTVVISIPLDKGTSYEISLGTEVRDIFDYQLDKVYGWEFKTYIPDVADNDDVTEEKKEDPLPKWLLDPTLWIISAVIIIILFIVITVYSRIHRKKKLERIWAAGMDEAPKKRSKEVEYDPQPDEVSNDDMGSIEDEITASRPPPDYNDLYGSYNGSNMGQGQVPDPPIDPQISSTPMTEGSGIDWDEDEVPEDDDEEWEMEEETTEDEMDWD